MTGMLINPYVFTAPGGGGGFDPLSIAWHTAFWAEDPDWTPPADGGTVSSWRNDGSSDWGDAASTGTGTEVTYDDSVAALNNRPALLFDAAKYLATTGGTKLASGVTVEFYAVIVNVATSTGYVMRSNEEDDTWMGIAGSVYTVTNNGGSAERTGGTPNTSAHLLRLHLESGAGDFFEVDGAAVISTGMGNDGVLAIDIGPAWDGYIAFAAIYAGTLGTSDLSDLEAWVADHYGVTIS